MIETSRRKFLSWIGLSAAASALPTSQCAALGPPIAANVVSAGRGYEEGPTIFFANRVWRSGGAVLEFSQPVKWGEE